MADDIYAQVGATIRAKRGEIGMTQAFLASKAGLGRTSITNIENGTQAIMLHQLVSLARALRADLADLIAGVDQPRDRPGLAAPSGMLVDLLGRLDKPVQARRR